VVLKQLIPATGVSTKSKSKSKSTHRRMPLLFTPESEMARHGIASNRNYAGAFIYMDASVSAAHATSRPSLKRLTERADEGIVYEVWYAPLRVDLFNECSI